MKGRLLPIVSGIQVTASINEELHQDGEVVPHSEMHRRGALMISHAGAGSCMDEGPDHVLGAT